MVRFVVRPNGIIATPRRICRWLYARRCFLIKPHRRFDWHQDFFLAYPPAYQLNEAPAGYSGLFSFYLSDKRRQRMLLQAEGVPVPFTCGLMDWEQRPSSLPYVVRPIRHTQGRNYRITYDPNDYNPYSEYISQVFPKRWEYRVITCKGEVICTLKKNVPETLSANDPWNHANGSSFCTVLDYDHNRLRHTDFYSRICSSAIIQSAHLTGIDVLVSKDRGEDFTYVVSEVNFAPALTLPHQLQALRQRVLPNAN